MEMEVVLAELQEWGELIVTTDAGVSYELHLGDTEFDTESRLIRLKTPKAVYLIDGDSVESIKKHYGHPMD